MGKRSKKMKVSTKITIIMIILLILATIAIIGIMVTSKDTYDNIKESDNGPIISYYSKSQQRKIKLADQEVINEHVVITFSEGTAKISKDDGEYVTYHDDEVLTDGRYIIVVNSDDNTFSKRTFTIDTKVPDVIGITDQGWYETEKKITIDFNDTSEAVLTYNGEERKLEGTGKESFTLKEVGTYKLYLKDKVGNSATYEFDIVGNTNN